MCLHIMSEELTAKEDIKVYKVIKINNMSPYTDFQYKSNTLYRLRKKLKIVNSEIHEGFHSFVSAYFVRKLYNSLKLFFVVKVVEFTIPKGAKYYLGRNGDIVSTSIRTHNLSHVIQLDNL